MSIYKIVHAMYPHNKAYKLGRYETSYRFISSLRLPLDVLPWRHVFVETESERRRDCRTDTSTQPARCNHAHRLLTLSSFGMLRWGANFAYWACSISNKSLFENHTSSNFRFPFLWPEYRGCPHVDCAGKLGWQDGDNDWHSLSLTFLSAGLFSIWCDPT